MPFDNTGSERRFHWLLAFRIDGRWYRYAVTDLEIDDRDGATHEYRGGLADLRARQGGEEIDVQVVDESVDWPVLAPWLEAGDATLHRWQEGTTIEAAELFVAGEARGVAHGAAAEPVEFRIQPRPGAVGGRGLQVPDPLAKVDETTWPIAGGTLGEAGSFYPVVFGAPGGLSDSAAVPVMPIAMSEYNAGGTTYAVIGEDGEMPATSVEARNDTRDAEASLTASSVVDGLGRRVRVVTVTSALRPTSATEAPRLFAGFTLGNGGSAGTVYEVLAYMLRRWRAQFVDWNRLDALADDLSIYQVDSWIDDPVDDPWAWLEGAVLRDIPFEVATGPAGLYLRRQWFEPTGRRLVGSVDVADLEAFRVSKWEREDAGPYNEFTGLYRQDVTDQWLGRVVVTGREGDVVSAPTGVSAPATTSTQLVTVEADSRCQRSLARFGLRQAQPLEVGWTWSTSTMSAVLSWRVERDAVPVSRAEYEIRGASSLQEGDEIELTDAEVGLDSVVCLVERTALVGQADWGTVTLRRKVE